MVYTIIFPETSHTQKDMGCVKLWDARLRVWIKLFKQSIRQEDWAVSSYSHVIPKCSSRMATPIREWTQPYSLKHSQVLFAQSAQKGEKKLEKLTNEL